MRTKRFLGFGVTAVLLALGLSLTLAGCGEESAGSPEGGGDPEDVTFSIALSAASLDGSETGAIRPNLEAAITDFVVDYKDISPGATSLPGSLPVKKDPDLSVVEVRLPRGTYELTVTGYAGTVPIAKTNTVTASAGQVVGSTFLAPLSVDEQGASMPEGTFDWDVGMSPDPGFHVTSIELAGRGPLFGENRTIATINAKTGQELLPPGTYQMTANVSENLRSPVVKELLIYAAVETKMKLGEDSFPHKEYDTITIVLDNTVLTQDGFVLTANPSFTAVEWFIDNESATVGVSDNGYTFDWAAASADSAYEVGSRHPVRLEGNVEHIWLSQTVWFERTEPTADVYYVNALTGSDKKGGTTPASAFLTLDKALKAPMKDTGKTVRIVGDYVIDTGAVTIDADPSSAGKPTVITRNEAGGTNGAVIKVEGGAAVTFRNVTIDGINGSVLNRGLLVTGTGARVTLDTGATVTGNSGSNAGGGVLLEDGATLTMKDGSTVTGSSAANGGGVAVGTDGGTFNMEGGVISGNTATGDGGGVYVDGGAAVKGTFVMTGGTVHGSTGTGANTASSGAALFVGTNGTATVGGAEQGTSTATLTVP
jgi:hypothetical protein